MNPRSSLAALLLVLAAAIAPAQAPVPVDIIGTPEPQATSTPAPTPIPTPEAIPEPTVELQTIEIVRRKSFVAEAAKPEPKTLSTMNAEDIRRQLRETGMKLEFQITPPKGWDLIAVESISLLGLTDSSGAPIGKLEIESGGAKGQIDNLSAAETSELNREYAVAQLRTPPPPRTDPQLRLVKARFKLQLGLKNTVHIHDLRSKVNQELLPDGASRGLSVQVTEVSPDRVVVAASGPIDEIGNLELVDIDKQPLRDLGREQSTLLEKGKERHMFTYYFKDLPQLIGMDIDIYPRTETQTVDRQWKNVELP